MVVVQLRGRTVGLQDRSDIDMRIALWGDLWARGCGRVCSVVRAARGSFSRIGGRRGCGRRVTAHGGPIPIMAPRSLFRSPTRNYVGFRVRPPTCRAGTPELCGRRPGRLLLRRQRRPPRRHVRLGGRCHRQPSAASLDPAFTDSRYVDSIPATRTRRRGTIRGWARCSNYPCMLNLHCEKQELLLLAGCRPIVLARDPRTCLVERTCSVEIGPF